MSSEPRTVHERLVATARRFPDKPFLAVLPETAATYGLEPGEISYGAVLAEAEELAARYRAAGYGPGHRVALLLENRPDFFRHWFALNAAGASVVPINPDLRAAELEYILGHSEATLAVATPARVGSLAAAAAAAGRDVPVIAPDEPPSAPRTSAASSPADAGEGEDRECALLYTSGTTGQPKGCVLTNLYFLEAGHWYAGVGGLCALKEGEERMLTPLPVFHMNAMAYSTMAMATTGGCLIVLDRFHPKSWWESVRAARATAVHYLGVMPPILMQAPALPEDRAHAVRFGFGAGVDRRLHAAFEERFGFPLVEAWAMTETGAGAVVAASHEPRHVGTSSLAGRRLRSNAGSCATTARKLMSRSRANCWSGAPAPPRAAASSRVISRTKRRPISPGRMAGSIRAMSCDGWSTAASASSTAART